MNYCSLQDAWGNSDYISNQFKTFDNVDTANNVTPDTIENFTDINYGPEDNSENQNAKILANQYNLISKPPNQISNRPNRSTHPKHTFTCNDFYDHVLSCSHCRRKLNNNSSSLILKKIKFFVLSNKDTLLLALIIIFIIVFLNLFISLFRK
jgi:hypothetical protein